MTDEDGYNQYMYRCLDKGILGAYMEFTLIDALDVRVTCDSSLSGAAVLAAGFAAATAFATVF